MMVMMMVVLMMMTIARWKSSIRNSLLRNRGAHFLGSGGFFKIRNARVFTGGAFLVSVSFAGVDEAVDDVVCYDAGNDHDNDAKYDNRPMTPSRVRGPPANVASAVENSTKTRPKTEL